MKRGLYADPLGYPTLDVDPCGRADAESSIASETLSTLPYGYINPAFRTEKWCAGNCPRFALSDNSAFWYLRNPLILWCSLRDCSALRASSLAPLELGTAAAPGAPASFAAAKRRLVEPYGFSSRRPNGCSPDEL